MKLFERFTVHMRLGRGGYHYGYDILNDFGVVIGAKSIHRETRKHDEVPTYGLIGDDRKFSTADELKAAYAEQLRGEAA